MIIFYEIFAIICAFAAAELPHPMSDKFIELINSKQDTWKAGRNFAETISYDYIKGLLGVRKSNAYSKLKRRWHSANIIANLPENFDPRDKWRNCPSLNEIADQGTCGSCWAVSGVAAITDRICVHSNGTKHFQVSAEDVVACCNAPGDEGCGGGDPSHTWSYWKEYGVVSGGGYNSSQGCRPYSIPPCEHFVEGNRPPCKGRAKTPKCVKACEANYKIDYDKDKVYGKNVYSIKGEDQIRAELYLNGPVGAGFTMYDDFLHYKSGVYKHTVGNFSGDHAVKMIGWGVENGMKYWLIANSFNTDWGDKGFFKILRGEDHCQVEDEIVAGLPVL